MKPVVDVKYHSGYGWYFRVIECNRLVATHGPYPSKQQMLAELNELYPDREIG